VSPAELLSWLRSEGVSLSAWGSRLKYAGPEEVLTEETRAAMRAAKDALLELLALEMLDDYGLARCRRCRRIMLCHHLTAEGRCEDERDCFHARQLAGMAARGRSGRPGRARVKAFAARALTSS